MGGRTGGKPILCEHRVLGKKKCPECRRIGWRSAPRDKRRLASQKWKDKNRKRTVIYSRKRNGIPTCGGETPVGTCPFCEKEKKLVPDHDHETGRMRGWVCGLCNRMLGIYEQVKKDGRLPKFEKYLEETDMSTFELAIPIILRREGGFNNLTNDPGGATNFGVSLRWLKAKGLLVELEQDEGDPLQSDVDAVKNMSQSEAESFYRKWWWDTYGYGSISAQSVATKVFDTAVNLGPSRAHKMLQQAVGVDCDGVLGPQTIRAVNANMSIPLLLSLQNIQAQFYRNLVLANPARQEFLAGWLARAYDKN